MPGLSFLINSGSLGEEAQRLAMGAAKVKLGFDAELRALADTISRVYIGMARGEAPRRTGKLGSEIKGRITAGAGGLSILFTSTDYTRYVIEGTGLFHKPDAHDVIRPKHAKSLRFEVDGQVTYRKYVSGQKPNDFQVRAYNKARPGIQAAMKLTSSELLLSFLP